MPEDWYSDQSATFGDRVTAARNALNLTQPELSRQLGIKLKTLRAWEEDLNEPRANKLQMLAGILNVSVSWLLCGAGDGLPRVRDEGEVPENELHDMVREVQKLRQDLAQTSSNLARLEQRLLTLANGE